MLSGSSDQHLAALRHFGRSSQLKPIEVRVPRTTSIQPRSWKPKDRPFVAYLSSLPANPVPTRNNGTSLRSYRKWLGLGSYIQNCFWLVSWVNPGVGSTSPSLSSGFLSALFRSSCDTWEMFSSPYRGDSVAIGRIGALHPDGCHQPGLLR